jgi:hypothetical protein
MSYAYQWKRGGVNISGATANTYTLVTADLGAMITATVTATNTAGSASATATAVGPVTAESSSTAFSLQAQPGSFAVSGESMEIVIAYLTQAGAGAFAFAGQSADLTTLTPGAIQAGAGAFAFAGQSATLTLSAATVKAEWSATDKSASYTVSSPPRLTATKGLGNEAIVRATVSKNSGKYYFEYVAANLNSFTCCGFANATHALDGEFLGSSPNGISYVPAGQVYVNNHGKGSGAAFVAGDVVGLAFDITAGKLWTRKNGGNWNNDILANQNPDSAAGPVVGGFLLTELGSGPFYPTAFDANATSVLTANFGQTAYNSAAPTGFLNWEA